MEHWSSRAQNIAPKARILEAVLLSGVLELVLELFSKHYAIGYFQWFPECSLKSSEWP